MPDVEPFFGRVPVKVQTTVLKAEAPEEIPRWKVTEKMGPVIYNCKVWEQIQRENARRQGCFVPEEDEWEELLCL